MTTATIDKNHLTPPTMSGQSKEGLPWIRIHGIWGLEKETENKLLCSDEEISVEVQVAVFRCPIWRRGKLSSRMEHEWYIGPYFVCTKKSE